MVLTTTDISQLYVTIFNRASEQGGNDFWRTQIALPPEGEDPFNRDLKAFTADEMLLTGPAQEYFGDTLLGDTPEQNYDFVEIIYLNTLNQTSTQDPGGIQFWADALTAGATHGMVVREIIRVLEDSPGTPNAIRIDNRVEVSDYAALTITQFDPRGVVGGPIETALTFFGQGKGSLVVTDADYTVIDAKSDIDEIPFLYEFTEADDNITGRAGDDTVAATLVAGIDSAPNTGTLNDADIYIPNGGSDTLALTTNITDFVTTSIPDGVDVNKLELISGNASDPGADVVWESIDFDKDFDEVTLDMGQQAYNVALNALPTTTAVTIKNLKGDGGVAKGFEFDSNTDLAGKTDITLMGDLAEVVGSKKIDFTSAVTFEAATTIQSTFSLSSFNDNAGSSYTHDLNVSDVAAEIFTTLNLDNIKSTDVSFLVDLETSLISDGTDALNAAFQTIINMNDLDNVQVDALGAGVNTGADMLVLNVGNVQNSNAGTSTYIENVEIANVNVWADAEFQEIDSNYNSLAGTEAVVNIDADIKATLTVDTWTLSNTASDTAFNIEGAGNVVIKDIVSTGANVVIDGFTATGDISLGVNGKLTDDISSIMTGAGNDTIAFSDTGALASLATIQGNGGGDTIDITQGVESVVYALASDSKAIFSEVLHEDKTLEIVMPGVDMIEGFRATADNGQIDLTALGLGFGDAAALDEIAQKGTVLLGTEAADLQYFLIRNSTDLFIDVDVSETQRATAFLDDGTNGYLFVDVNSDGDFSESADMVIKFVAQTVIDIADITFV